MQTLALFVAPAFALVVLVFCAFLLRAPRPRKVSLRSLREGDRLVLADNAVVTVAYVRGASIRYHEDGGCGWTSLANVRAVIRRA